MFMSVIDALEISLLLVLVVTLSVCALLHLREIDVAEPIEHEIICPSKADYKFKKPCRFKIKEER